MDNRLYKWIAVNCNGDWEHQYGIRLQTLDNPGWILEIDLINTPLESLEYYKKVDSGDFDWYQVDILNKTYRATSSLNNLSVLIETFFNELLVGSELENFKYQAFIPIKFNNKLIYKDVICSLTKDLKLKIKEIPPFSLVELKAREVEELEGLDIDLLKEKFIKKISKKTQFLNLNW